jgi:hypothetical protein
MAMSSVLEEASRKLAVAPWWAESVAIEYLDCRELCVGEQLWRFNFERLSVDEVIAAIREHRLVMRGCLAHNVLPEVVIQRTMRSFVGAPSLNPGYGGDVLPEGPVSETWFAMPDNAIENVDPKLSGTLGRCQILDDGRLWQWYFGKDGPLGFRESDVVDLTAFDRVKVLLKQAEALRCQPGSTGYGAYLDATKTVYRVAEEVRAPIRERLLRLHADRKKTASDAAIVRGPPPRLTYFERFRVRDHEYETCFVAEPMFYRSCLARVKRARELSSGQNDVSKLLDIYEERAGAIIMASACLEAYVNGVLREKHEGLFRSTERLPFPDKWHLALALSGKPELWHSGEQPFQTLSDVYSSRNELMHHKGTYARVCRDKNRVRTRTESSTLDEQLVDGLPSRLKELIILLASSAGMDRPEWLDSSSGWDLPK